MVLQPAGIHQAMYALRRDAKELGGGGWSEERHLLAIPVGCAQYGTSPLKALSLKDRTLLIDKSVNHLEQHRIGLEPLSSVVKVAQRVMDLTLSCLASGDNS